jgi:hypothetical protein
MAGTERQRELRRRRHRRKKLGVFERKVAKASKSEKAIIVQKVRRLTPGADAVINNWGLKD